MAYGTCCDNTKRAIATVLSSLRVHFVDNLLQGHGTATCKRPCEQYAVRYFSGMPVQVCCALRSGQQKKQSRQASVFHMFHKEMYQMPISSLFSCLQVSGFCCFSRRISPEHTCAQVLGSNLKQPKCSVQPAMHF